MIKLLPILRPGVNEQLFCKFDADNAFVIDDFIDDPTDSEKMTWVKSGFLRVGKSLDLLGVSTDKALREMGLQDPTDQIAPQVRISHVAIGKDDGVVRGIVSLPALPLAGFQVPTDGNLRTLKLEYRGTDIVFDGNRYTASLSGRLSLDTGTLEMSGTLPVGSAWGVIGYRLEAYRSNPNRRAH